MKKENKNINKLVMLNLIQHLRRLSLRNNNNVRGRFQIKFGMTSLLNTSAFTLIELLVVVLIIGILAAIALPQYQKAVTRAKTAELFTLMDTVAKGAKTYLLEHGNVTYWNNMISSSPIGMQSANIYSSFEPHFQVGTGAISNGANKYAFLCVQPKNGDNAYFYYLIYSNGQERRVCSGDDCGKYITNASCFASENTCHKWDDVAATSCGF